MCTRRYTHPLASWPPTGWWICSNTRWPGTPGRQPAWPPALPTSTATATAIRPHAFPYWFWCPRCNPFLGDMSIAIHVGLVRTESHYTLWFCICSGRAYSHSIFGLNPLQSPPCFSVSTISIWAVFYVEWVVSFMHCTVVADSRHRSLYTATARPPQPQTGAVRLPHVSRYVWLTIYSFVGLLLVHLLQRPPKLLSKTTCKTYTHTDAPRNSLAYFSITIGVCVCIHFLPVTAAVGHSSLVRLHTRKR